MKYIKPFNESAEINPSKKYLASQPYIGTYTTKYNFGKLFIRNVELTNYQKFLLSNEKITTLSYKSLFRFLLFAFIYKYDGDNEIINRYQETLNNHTHYNKNDHETNDFLRIINQMPKNNILISELFKSGLVKTKNTSEENYDILADMHKNMKLIFNEENFINWYNRINKITKISDKKEKQISDMINNNKNIRLKNARKAEGDEDIGGVDIIAYTYQDVKKTIQVKMFKKMEEKRVNDNYYTLTLFNSKLDLKKYNKFDDGYLEYDFLFLISKQEIISINSKSIVKITPDLNKKTIEIKLYLTDNWFNRMLKRYKNN